MLLSYLSDTIFPLLKHKYGIILKSFCRKKKKEEKGELRKRVQKMQKTSEKTVNNVGKNIYKIRISIKNSNRGNKIRKKTIKQEHDRKSKKAFRKQTRRNRNFLSILSDVFLFSVLHSLYHFLISLLKDKNKRKKGQNGTVRRIKTDNQPII